MKKKAKVVPFRSKKEMRMVVVEYMQLVPVHSRVAVMAIDLLAAEAEVEKMPGFDKIMNSFYHKPVKIAEAKEAENALSEENHPS